MGNAFSACLQGNRSTAEQIEVEENVPAHNLASGASLGRGLDIEE